MSSTNTFSTFVINLDKDTERMEFMDTQLKNLGISYERESAANPKEQDLSGEYSESLARTKGKHLLVPGEVGCAVSHKRIYQKMIEQDLSYALILEDDVQLPEGFKEEVERQIERNKGTWEYLLFDYPEVGSAFIRNWIRSIGVNFKEIKKKGYVMSLLFVCHSLLKAVYILPLALFEGWRNSYKEGNPGPVLFLRPLYFAGAYLVSLSGAEKLISLASPIRYTADKLPNQARVQKGLMFRAYAPLCVQQLKKRFGSSILELPGDKI